VLYLFYLSFAHEPSGPTKNAIDGLREAYYNLPQYQPLDMSYVHELLRAHNTEQAALILHRIAYLPHGGPAAQWAQGVLKDIDKKEGQPEASTDAPAQ